MLSRSFSGVCQILFPIHIIVTCSTSYKTGATTCVSSSVAPSKADADIIGGSDLCVTDPISGDTGNFCSTDATVISGYAWHICKRSAYCTGDGYLRSCAPGT